MRWRRLGWTVITVIIVLVASLVAARLLYFNGTEEKPPFTLPPRTDAVVG
jgi:hypothetical protein